MSFEREKKIERYFEGGWSRGGFGENGNLRGEIKQESIYKDTVSLKDIARSSLKKLEMDSSDFSVSKLARELA